MIVKNLRGGETRKVEAAPIGSTLEWTGLAGVRYSARRVSSRRWEVWHTTGPVFADAESEMWSHAAVASYVDAINASRNEYGAILIDRTIRECPRVWRVVKL